MALDSRRMNQIFQTMTCRLDEGLKGPPDSYDPEEKDYYAKIEAEYLENKKEGFKGTYSFPNDYD